MRRDGTHGSGTFSDTTRNVVVGTVTRAEPTTVCWGPTKTSSVCASLCLDHVGVRRRLTVTGLTQGDTTQVGADTEHDQPLGSLNTVVVLLRITEGLDVDLVGLVDLVGGSVTDKDGLSADRCGCERESAGGTMAARAGGPD